MKRPTLTKRDVGKDERGTSDLTQYPSLPSISAFGAHAGAHYFFLQLPYRFDSLTQSSNSISACLSSPVKPSAQRGHFKRYVLQAPRPRRVAASVRVSAVRPPDEQLIADNATTECPPLCHRSAEVWRQWYRVNRRIGPCRCGRRILLLQPGWGHSSTQRTCKGCLYRRRPRLPEPEARRGRYTQSQHQEAPIRAAGE